MIANIVKSGEIIMGLDLGLSNFGYAIIKNHKYFSSYTTHGCLLTSKHEPMHKRIQRIYILLEEILIKFKPNKIIIEKVFHHSNSKTVGLINQVHGMIYLLIARYDIWFTELTPIQVKIGIGLTSKSKKKDVISKIAIYFGIKEGKSSKDDSFDALAITLAYCRLNKLPFYKRLGFPGF